MARWYALNLERAPVGPAFEAPDRTAAEQIAHRIYPLCGGGWKVMSVLEFEDCQREAEAKARQAAKKLRWVVA